MIITNKKPVEDEYILETYANPIDEIPKKQLESSLDSQVDYNHGVDGLEDEQILKSITKANGNRKYHLK